MKNSLNHGILTVNFLALLKFILNAWRYITLKKLTTSRQHYIKAVYELDKGSGARISDIAINLGHTKASVCVAMKGLEDMGYIRRDENRLVHLTDDGKWQALVLLDKFAIVKYFLTEVLKVDPETAEVDSCSIEHVISNETLCSICRFIDYKSEKKACSGKCHLLDKKTESIAIN
ncbi:MAG: metal-dependent transcriptional regulator [Lachnospiraceae bacterium]|nr:metal-dependent transcriptional regulator [Lachnospiraceae bacterium]